MKPLDIVTIYEDPYTEKRIEGKAKLIKCVDDHHAEEAGRIVQHWIVRFVGAGFVDEPEVHRLVYKPKNDKAVFTSKKTSKSLTVQVVWTNGDTSRFTVDEGTPKAALFLFLQLSEQAVDRSEQDQLDTLEHIVTQCMSFGAFMFGKSIAEKIRALKERKNGGD